MKTNTHKKSIPFFVLLLFASCCSLLHCSDEFSSDDSDRERLEQEEPPLPSESISELRIRIDGPNLFTETIPGTVKAFVMPTEDEVSWFRWTVDGDPKTIVEGAPSNFFVYNARSLTIDQPGIHEIELQVTFKDNRMLTTTKQVEVLKLYVIDTPQKLTDILEEKSIRGHVILTDGFLESPTQTFRWEALERVEGHLTVEDSGRRIRDKLSFPNLIEVTGDLTIHDDTVLHSSIQSLEFSKLQTVGGALRLTHLDMKDFSGFPRLTRAGRISIALCSHIESFVGSPDLKSVSSLVLSSLDRLRTLEGLESLTSISGHISLWNLPVLQNFLGLHNLKTVGGHVGIERADALVNLAGLEQLTRIQGVLEIAYNERLQTTQGLSHLTQLGGLRIHNNAKLSAIQGLGTVSEIPGSVLLMNPMLSDISGLKSLQTIGTLTISNLSPQQALTLQGLSGLKRIRRNFVLNNNNLNRLNGLEALEHIGGEFYLRENRLKDLDGLSALKTVGMLDIYLENELVSLKGLHPSIQVLSIKINRANALLHIRALSHIKSLDRLELFYLPLASLQGLDKLTTVGNLVLGGMPRLTSLAALASLEEVQSSLGLIDLEALKDVKLANLKAVQGDIQIDKCPLLEGFLGLEKLTSIKGNLFIYNNDTLKHLQGLNALQSIGGHLRMYRNKALEGLNGLETLARVGGNLDIRQSPKLPWCLAEALKAQLTQREGLGGEAIFEDIKAEEESCER